jgi:hypothetical protein
MTEIDESETELDDETDGVGGRVFKNWRGSATAESPASLSSLTVSQRMVSEGGSHPAFTCEVCHSDMPWWRVLRDGDVVVSWACFSHLSDVCLAMQRSDGRSTELVVTEARS